MPCSDRDWTVKALCVHCKLTLTRVPSAGSCPWGCEELGCSWRFFRTVSRSYRKWSADTIKGCSGTNVLVFVGGLGIGHANTTQHVVLEDHQRTVQVQPCYRLCTCGPPAYATGQDDALSMCKHHLGLCPFWEPTTQDSLTSSKNYRTYHIATVGPQASWWRD